MESTHARTYIWQHRDWPHLTVDLQAILGPLAIARQAQGMALGQARAIGLLMQSAILDEIWIGEVVATAAIEGEALNLDAVRSSVKRMLGDDHGGPVQRHVDGLVAVMQDASEHFAVPLDLDRLCRWQAALFPTGLSGIQRIQTGQLRTFAEPMQIVGGRIGREVVHFQAPPSEVVSQELAALIAWFNNPPAGLDGLVRAALVHLWFETIHPFEDGNGRLGRALIDLALAQDLGASARLFSMSQQINSHRQAYYDELNQAQTGQLDVTAWVVWFLAQFSAACSRATGVIDAALAKQRFWSHYAEIPLTERQRKVLKKLLDVGKDGFMAGLSVQHYCAIAQISKPTATRDLAALVQVGILTMSGEGKATRYHLVPFE
jgi:Fic family protein